VAIYVEVLRGIFCATRNHLSSATYRSGPDSKTQYSRPRLAVVFSCEVGCSPGWLPIGGLFTPAKGLGNYRNVGPLKYDSVGTSSSADATLEPNLARLRTFVTAPSQLVLNAEGKVYGLFKAILQAADGLPSASTRQSGLPKQLMF